MTRHLTIGTRGSALALRQAEMIRDRLLSCGAVSVELRVMTTKGDRTIDRPLPQIGGKGLFTEELESALLHEEIDLAVHSLKDLPTEMRPELAVGAIPERESPYDVWVSAYLFRDIPAGSQVGTSSLRRRAQLLAQRPDLCVIDLRGNLDTRLRKVREPGGPDAAVLAEAGLNRLGLAEHIQERFSPEVMLPAGGQGALGIQCRADDWELMEALRLIDDPATRAEVSAERSLLDRLEGGCHVPIGCLGRCQGERLTLWGGVFHLDGSSGVRNKVVGSAIDAVRLGIELAERLLDMGAREILRAIQPIAVPDAS